MKIRQTIMAAAVALATFGVSQAQAITNLTTYNWSYKTTSDILSDCQGYCSGYTYLAHFSAYGTLTVDANNPGTAEIQSGVGTLSVTQKLPGGTTQYNGTFTLTDVAPDGNYPNTITNANWVWDNVLPIDTIGGPLFEDSSHDQFNIWAYGSNLPTIGIPEVVTTAAAGFSLAGTGYSADFLDARGTFIISVVPEPATWAMLLIGFGAIGFAMRASQRRQGAIA